MERDRILLGLLMQALRRLTPVSGRPAAPLSESALRLAQQWERLSPEDQAAIQASRQALPPLPPEQ